MPCGESVLCFLGTSMSSLSFTRVCCMGKGGASPASVSHCGLTAWIYLNHSNYRGVCYCVVNTWVSSAGTLNFCGVEHGDLSAQQWSFSLDKERLRET